MARTVQSAKKKATPKKSKVEILAARRERLLKKLRWEKSAWEKSTAALATCEAALLRLQSAGPPKASALAQLAQDLHADEDPGDFINPYDQD